MAAEKRRATSHMVSKKAHWLNLPGPLNLRRNKLSPLQKISESVLIENLLRSNLNNGLKFVNTVAL